MIQNIKNSFRLYKRALKVYMPKTAVPSFIRLSPNVFPGFKLKNKKKNLKLNSSWHFSCVNPTGTFTDLRLFRWEVFPKQLLSLLCRFWNLTCFFVLKANATQELGFFPVFSMFLFCHRLKSFKRKTNACLRTVTVESFEL